jgi:hypothetical protein
VSGIKISFHFGFQNSASRTADWNNLADAIRTMFDQAETRPMSLAQAIEALPLDFPKRARLWTTLSQLEPEETEDQTEMEYNAEARKLYADAIIAKIARFRKYRIPAEDETIAEEFDADAFLARATTI